MLSRSCNSERVETVLHYLTPRLFERAGLIEKPPGKPAAEHPRSALRLYLRPRHCQIRDNSNLATAAMETGNS